MTWFFVDIQLEILIVIHETSPRLVDRQVKGICLTQEVGVLTMADGSLDLNYLTSDLLLLSDGVDVGVLSLATSFSQPTLHRSAGGLEIIVGDLINAN